MWALRYLFFLRKRLLFLRINPKYFYLEQGNSYYNIYSWSTASKHVTQCNNKMNHHYTIKYQAISNKCTIFTYYFYVIVHKFTFEFLIQIKLQKITKFSVVPMAIWHRKCCLKAPDMTPQPTGLVLAACYTNYSKDTHHSVNIKQRTNMK